ncbi:MAG: hypothetical protein RLO06_18475 [Parvibaculum sp.]
MHAAALIVVLGLALVGGIFANHAYQRSEDQAFLAKYVATVETLTRNLDLAAAQSGHPDGATLPDLTTIAVSSIEADTDAWGTTVRLCLNDVDDTLPAITVLSAGPDRVRNTDCTAALAGSLTGDDLIKSLRSAQVFARQPLTPVEQEMTANYTNRCSLGFDLLEKPTEATFACFNLCAAFRSFSERYGYHDTPPDWSSCSASP